MPDDRPVRLHLTLEEADAVHSALEDGVQGIGLLYGEVQMYRAVLGQVSGPFRGRCGPGLLPP